MTAAGHSVARLAAAARKTAFDLGVPLIVRSSVEAAPDQCTDAALLILAEPDLLLVLPVVDAPARQLQGLLQFAGGFSTYRLRERRWQWSSVLAVQLEQLIALLASTPPPADDGCAPVHVYLQGGFQCRYFPAGAEPLARLPAPERACRASNPRLPAIMRAFGPDSVHDLQCGPTPDRESWFQFNAALSIVGIGRGTTDRQMRLGAGFEYVERWVASGLPRAARLASHAELGSDALSPEAVWGIPATRAAAAFPGFDSNRRIHWLPVESTTDRKRKWIPLDMVNYRFVVEHPTTPHRNSNGCALGNSPSEAALFAALEVIERDALLLVWYSRSVPPRFDLSTVGTAPGQELLQLLALRGYAVAVFDISTEYRMPTVLVLLSGSTGNTLASFVTAACHPDPETAFLSALAEAKSLLATAERNYCRAVAAAAVDDGLAQGRPDAQYQHFARPDQRHHFDFLRTATPTLAYSDFLAGTPACKGGARAAFERLTARIAALGQSLLICDNTPPALLPLGLHSCRAYLPGAIHLTFGTAPPPLPPERFRQSARHVPWVHGGDVPQQLMPHPLG